MRCRPIGWPWPSSLTACRGTRPCTCLRRSTRPARSCGWISASSTGPTRSGTTSRGPIPTTCWRPPTPWRPTDAPIGQSAGPGRLVRLCRLAAALYHGILGIPKTERGLEHAGALTWRQTSSRRRSGRLNRSASQNNRLINSRIPLRRYWRELRFAGNRGRQNLFERPLGRRSRAVPARRRRDHLQPAQRLARLHAGRCRRQPHRQRAHADRQRSAAGRPRRAQRRLLHVLPLRRHDLEVRRDPAVRRGQSPGVPRSRRDPALSGRRELKRVLEEDGRRFAEALRGVGLKKASRTGEPISTMALRFEQELDLRHAAAEFGLAVADFSLRLEQAPALAPQAPQGSRRHDQRLSGNLRPALDLRIVLVRGPRGRPVLPQRSVGPDLAIKSRDLGEMSWGVSSLASLPTAAGWPSARWTGPSCWSISTRPPG